MPRTDEIGQMLVSTSCHLTVEQLKAIRSLGVGQSAFIRQAVQAALERRKGVEPMIRITRGKIEHFEEKVKFLREELTRLESLKEEQDSRSLEEQRVDIIRRAIINVRSYKGPKDVLRDLYDHLSIQNRKDEASVLRQIERLWNEYHEETPK